MKILKRAITNGTKALNDITSQIEAYRTPKRQNYVGRNRPFPMNETFIPKAPISDATRESIFKLYMEDSSKWTPRRLAEEFGLSIIRIEAILRLKSLQVKLEADGIPAQKNLVVGMENMLGAVQLGKNTAEKRSYEPIRELVVKGMNPFQKLIDDDEKLTPQDAAELLRLEPFANIEKKLDRKAEQVFKVSPDKDKPEPISSNDAMTGKYDFIFVDTSKDSKKILVRDTKGVLRKASAIETWRFAKKSKKMSM